jgi:inner membrane protein
LLQSQARHPHVQRMLRFTDGLMRLRMEDGRLSLTDLRMGQEGAYVFDFDLGPPLAPGQAAPVAEQRRERPDVRQSLQWLWARLWGADLAPLSADAVQGRANL